MQQQFAHLKKAYQASPFPSYKERIAILKSIQRMVLENESKIVEKISADFSYREPFETQIAEIAPSIKALKYTIKQLPRWMQAESRTVSALFKPASASIMYQPLGVVGVIVPWNYPLLLALGPLIAALSAGNRVLLKMSELTPSFSQLFADLCAQYLPTDWVSVVTGDEKVAANFSKLPFNHLLFTGSTHIGKKVMAAASENLTPVTLELGGKSPTIIDRGYPLEKAVERILFGKLLNAGQTCLAPDYLFVAQQDLPKVVGLLVKKCQQFFPDQKLQNLSAMANDKQHQRYQDLLADAKQKGAKLVPLLEHLDGQSIDNTRKVIPMAVTQVCDELLLMQQEIFAPILPIMSYQSIEQVVEYINQRPHPLALYLFSHNRKTIDTLMEQTLSGGVTLNDTILHVSQESLPFGGVGHSGMGHYHGIEGFKTFSKAKSIFKQSRFASSKLIYPPYGKLAHWIYRLMKKG